VRRKFKINKHQKSKKNQKKKTKKKKKKKIKKIHKKIRKKSKKIHKKKSEKIKNQPSLNPSKHTTIVFPRSTKQSIQKGESLGECLWAQSMLFRSFPPAAITSLKISTEVQGINAKLDELEECHADSMSRIECQLRKLNGNVQMLQHREYATRLREPLHSCVRCCDLEAVRGELAGLSQQVAALVTRLESTTLQCLVSRANTPAQETTEHAALLLAVEQAAAGALAGRHSRRASDASDSSFCLP